MRCPKSRQRPCSSSQDRSGTLSRARISVSQPGQRERGLTIDWPFGTRWITTLRKLPITAPSGRMAAATVSIGSARAGQLAPGVLHDPGGAEGRERVEGVGAVLEVG